MPIQAKYILKVKCRKCKSTNDIPLSEEKFTDTKNEPDIVYYIDDTNPDKLIHVLLKWLTSCQLCKDCNCD